MDIGSLKDKIVPLIMGIVIGVIFVAVGVQGIIKERRLKELCIEETDAVIVDFYKVSSSDSSNTHKGRIHSKVTYYPVYEYTTDKGGTVRVNGEKKTNKKVGDKIKIFYNPDDEDESYIPYDTPILKYAGFVICGLVFGTLFEYGIISSSISDKNVKHTYIIDNTTKED